MNLQEMKSKVAFYGVEAVRAQFKKEQEFCKQQLLECDVNQDQFEAMPDHLLPDDQRTRAMASVEKLRESFKFRLDRAKTHEAMVEESVKAIEVDAVSRGLKGKK